MAVTNLREKYRGISRQKLFDKAYELGYGYESNSQSCSQSVVAAIHELVGIDDVVVKVATSLGGGSAMQVFGTCGTLSGGIMVLDYFFGRPLEVLSYHEIIPATRELLYTAAEAPKLLAEKFWNEYGTITCLQIQRKVAGSFCYSKNLDEEIKMREAKLHPEIKYCPSIVGNGARWVMEILLERGAVKL